MLVSQLQRHVVLVHIRAANFERPAFVPEDLKSERGVETFRRGLASVHSKRYPLQARLLPSHPEQLLEQRFSDPFAAPARRYVDSPENTVVVPLRFRSTTEAGGSYNLPTRKSADDETAARGVRTEPGPGLIDRHRAMLFRRLAEGGRFSLQRFQAKGPEGFGIALGEQANMHV